MNKVDKVAKALWDLNQSHSYTKFASNEIMFGSGWAGKSVPWEYLFTEDVVSDIAEEYRLKASVAIDAFLKEDAPA